MPSDGHQILRIDLDRFLAVADVWDIKGSRADIPIYAVQTAFQDFFHIVILEHLKANH